MGKKKKAKPPEKRKRNIFEIRRDAHFRKLAKLMRKRERLLDKLAYHVLAESILEFKTADAIEKFLAQKK